MTAVTECGCASLAVMWRWILLTAGVSTMAQGAENIVFDTDPLYFTDDGHAAVMLLRSPEKVRILGMTLVSGNSWAAEGADYMWDALKALGRTEVPLYVGAQAPLIHTLAMAKEESREWGPFEYMAAFQRPFV